MTNIRPARPTDLADIHDLVAELAAYVNASDQLTASVATYEQDLRDGFFEAIVAEHDGKIVGMMLYYNAYSTWKGRMIYLEDFVLAPAYRRRGIGTQLWQALREIGRRRGCRLMKWQIAEANTEAVKFYAAMGAEIEADWLNGKVWL